MRSYMKRLSDIQKALDTACYLSLNMLMHVNHAALYLVFIHNLCVFIGIFHLFIIYANRVVPSSLYACFET